MHRTSAWLAAAGLLLLVPRAYAQDPTRPDSLQPIDPERHLLIQAEAGGTLLGPERVRAGAETFTDPATDITFSRGVEVTRLDGSTVRLKALGSGVRKKLVVKVYGAALYADEAASLGSDPLDALNRDDFARRLVMTFKRGVDGKKIREAYREGLEEKVWKTKPGHELGLEFETFLGYFDGGVKEGESIELTYLPGEGLYTSVAGQPKPIIVVPQIARQIWSVWLGNEPVSGDLRNNLVRFLKPGD